MRIDPERVKFFNSFARPDAKPMSPVQKFFATLGAAGIFVLALMFSVVLFAAVAAVGAVAWGYLWWKTRDLRKKMRETKPDEGLVLEGEVIREGEAPTDYRP